MTEKKEKLIPIRKLISFWEDSLATHRLQMTPSTIALTEQTILRLNQLDKMICEPDTNVASEIKGV